MLGRRVLGEWQPSEKEVRNDAYHTYLTKRRHFRRMITDIRIMASRHNLDIQLLFTELRENYPQINKSEFLCDMIRLGIANLVKTSPERVTPQMLEIAKAAAPEIKLPEIPRIQTENDRDVPSVINFYKTPFIRGKRLEDAFVSGLVSAEDLMDMWTSSVTLTSQIIDSRILCNALFDALDRSPVLQKLEQDYIIAFEKNRLF